MGNEFIKNMRYLIKCFLSIIYAKNHNCIICKSYSNENMSLCVECNSKIKRCNEPFEIELNGYNIKAYSSLYYSGITKELISRLKYKSDFIAGEVLAKIMLETLSNAHLNIQLITFVPATRKNLRKRGYNQTEYLAKTIGRETDIKVIRLLRKVKETKDQIGLSGEERWLNINNSYEGINKKNIIGKSILIIDDVITTGATAFYCAKALMDKGAKEVYVLTGAKSKI